jgi:hypothetical protein
LIIGLTVALAASSRLSLAVIYFALASAVLLATLFTLFAFIGPLSVV